MHRLPAAWLAFLVVVPLSVAQPAKDSTLIFRHANFGPDWIVSLGQPLDVPPPLLADGSVVHEGDGVYSLGFYNPFDYGDVLVVVTVRTDFDGLVASMRFDYGPGYDFAYERDDYLQVLGVPTQRDVSDEGEVVTWQDDATRFILVREITSEGEEWHSILSEAGGERL